MSLFPQISPTLLALTLIPVTGGMLLVLLGLALTNPLLLRMGLRNSVRRPGKTILLLCGLALATAVITASFCLQDSFIGSAATQRIAHMGDVDESITGPFTQDQIDRDLARIRAFPQVQAVSALGIYPQSPTVTSLRTGFAVHDVDFYALPPDFDQVYGAFTDVQGQTVSLANLGMNEALVSASLVQGLGAEVGDRVQLQFGEKMVIVTVRGLLSHDIGVTAGEAISAATPQIILSLAAARQIDTEPPNTISIRNAGTGNSQAVMSFLQQLFPDASVRLDVPHALGQTSFDVFRIHPLKPNVVQETLSLTINKIVFLSPAGQQFTWLPPLFTCLLVGAGMLLLALLIILLAAERRTELGLSRALGLSRLHLIQLQLFEGCSYGILAALPGTLLGVGITALELSLLALLPKLGVGEAANSVQVPVIGTLQLWVSWQSLFISWCIGVLATTATVLVTAIWTSRMNIVATIHDLEHPVGRRWSKFWRFSFSLIGVGLLVGGLRQGNAFLALFQPGAAFNDPPSTLNLLLGMLLPIVGAVVLAMTNLDLLTTPLSVLLRYMRAFAPIHRTGLAYPQTFRFRTGVTVTLLSLMVFLVMLLVTTNLGAIQEAENATSSGGFQLQATLFGSQLVRYNALPGQLQALQARQSLGQDFAAVGLVRLMYDFPQQGGQAQPIRLDIDGGQLLYNLSKPPQVADDAFLASTSLPLYARAAGFETDQQVWDALRTHQGYAVLQYDAQVVGLPASTGFTPFTAEIPDSSAPAAHYHRVTVVGLIPANAPWRVLLSIETASTVVQPPYIAFLSTYLFRLKSGVNEI